MPPLPKKKKYTVPDAKLVYQKHFVRPTPNDPRPRSVGVPRVTGGRTLIPYKHYLRTVDFSIPLCRNKAWCRRLEQAYGSNQTPDPEDVYKCMDNGWCTVRFANDVDYMRTYEKSCDERNWCKRLRWNYAGLKDHIKCANRDWCFNYLGKENELDIMGNVDTYCGMFDWCQRLKDGERRPQDIEECQKRRWCQRAFQDSIPMQTKPEIYS